MPKLKYRLTVHLGEWTQIADPLLGDGRVMLTVRPKGPHIPGEAILDLDETHMVVHTDGETLVRWGCAEAVELSEADVIAGDEPPLVGCLVDLGESEEHEATPETGYAVAFVRMPIENARQLAPQIGQNIQISRGTP